MFFVRQYLLQVCSKSQRFRGILQNDHQLLNTIAVTPKITSSRLADPRKTLNLPCSHVCCYSTEISVSENADIFGDIAGKKFEEFPLDSDEQEQEHFEKTEAMIPKRLKLSKGRYADLIKKHITKGDLESAVNVLDLVKQNRDKPTTYMYTLLLRAFAVQGDVKKVWKLFTTMKKRALKLNAATYVNVINACANSSKREVALEYLEKIRQEIIEKDVILNEVHYNALVKAYGKHNCLLEAFQVVDQMIDKKMRIGVATFNSLLYACVSNRENGLRHALVVWHMMQRWRSKPDLQTYNLILRAIRDTNMGDLQTNDLLLENNQASKVLISDSRTPDLLAHPPVVSNILLTMENTDDIAMNSEAPSNTLAVVDNKTKFENFKLGDIHQKNKLILFGGFNGFMQRLEADKIEPNVKTLTLLLDLVPNSLAIEGRLLDAARMKKIPLDIDFFNMLIKKRSFRKDYKHAKKVVDDIQRHNLVPNMMTWGVLALGCRTLEEAKLLLNGLTATGHTFNTVIAGSFLGNACCSNSMDYILEIIKLMTIERIRPSKHIYTILDKYKLKIENTLHQNRSSKLYRNKKFHEKFVIFKNRYEKFQMMFDRQENTEYIRKRSS